MSRRDNRGQQSARIIAAAKEAAKAAKATTGDTSKEEANNGAQKVSK